MDLRHDWLSPVHSCYSDNFPQCFTMPVYYSHYTLLSYRVQRFFSELLWIKEALLCMLCKFIHGSRKSSQTIANTSRSHFFSCLLIRCFCQRFRRASSYLALPMFSASRHLTRSAAVNSQFESLIPKTFMSRLHTF